MSTRIETAEAMGYALGVLLPDILRNLKNVNNVAEMHDLFSTFLDRHREGLATSPLPLPHRPAFTAFFIGMQNGVDGWGAHASDEH